MEKRHQGISSFSIILLMAVAAVIGFSCARIVHIQYTPVEPSSSIYVSFTMAGASAEVVEMEATSRIEAALAHMTSCAGLSSVSSDGKGTVTMTVRKGSDMQIVRFEAASLLRGLFPSLPKGCSYPSVSTSSSGEESRSIISYSLKSSLPSEKIGQFAESVIQTPLSMLDGVSAVTIGGWTPYEWVITFDQRKVSSLGISAGDIKESLQEYCSEHVAGLLHQDGAVFTLKTRNSDSEDFMMAPVSVSDGRVIFLKDIASAEYQESSPSSYYRLNGLNTVSLSVEASSDANILTVAREVKSKMNELSRSFPNEIKVSVAYDYTEYIHQELEKIYLRTALCLIILLLFVLLVSKSWRYTLVILITIIVNLLVSIAVYAISGLPIHIYTLAGVTVSLGIMIDNSIVMADHFSRTNDRRVFTAILASVLTTVVSLAVIFLLPDRDKANLLDFSKVIVINLAVSLLVSYLFVPALLDVLPADQTTFKSKNRAENRKRWEKPYERYITWSVNHRWVLIVASLALFGIPTCVLPIKAELDSRKDLTIIENTARSIVSWSPYDRNRRGIDKVLSSSFGLFYRSLASANFYREPERPALHISAAMPEGNSVGQLNEVMLSMEHYLSGFDEIEIFETRITSARNGRIDVFFRPEHEMSGFPSYLKSEVMKMASNFGGARWSVYGINDITFDNNISTDLRTYQIDLKGYDYHLLSNYADTLVSILSRNRRISNAEVWGKRYRPSSQYNITYDFESLTSRDQSPYSYYSAMTSPLFSEVTGSTEVDGRMVDVRLESSLKDEFDLWNVVNAGVDVDSSRVKLASVGKIEKKRTGLVIEKDNQSYALSVRFDFLGSYALMGKITEEAVEHMNRDILPIGFKASIESEGGWFENTRQNYAFLIFLIIAVIFIILAIYFESLTVPLTIIWMIPVSFVGLFITYGSFNVIFDKGGFAAFVMLCGISVNAGIYLIDEYRRNGDMSVKGYLYAFKNKITPIMLTISSTILGLIPFLLEGTADVFWFSFAIGTIGGLVFSLVAVLLILPIAIRNLC